jgi:uncharacterized protein (TIGR02145 family)
MKCIRKFLLFILFFEIALFFFSCKDDILEPIKVTPGTFTDTRDGRIYKTTTINNYTWLAENLDFAIDSGSCYYDNDSINNKIYGHYYNWQASQIAIPEGWHLPNYDELNYLKITFGGGYEVARQLGNKGYSGLEINSSGFYSADSSQFVNCPPSYWCENNNIWVLWYYALTWQKDDSLENRYTIRCVKNN